MAAIHLSVEWVVCPLAITAAPCRALTFGDGTLWSRLSACLGNPGGSIVVYHASLSRGQEAGEPWLRRPFIQREIPPPRPPGHERKKILFEVTLKGFGAPPFAPRKPQALAPSLFFRFRHGHRWCQFESEFLQGAARRPRGGGKTAMDVWVAVAVAVAVVVAAAAL